MINILINQYSQKCKRQTHLSLHFFSLHLTSFHSLILLFLFSFFHSAQAQTIRNSNNASIATIESDGTVRNSSNSTIGCIESDGDIRDRSNAYIGKIESDGTVRDRNNAYIGRIESDGTVRNRNGSYLGKVESDGTVRDSSNRTLGTARGVPQRYAALYFFFDFFK